MILWHWNGVHLRWFWWNWTLFELLLYTWNIIQSKQFNIQQCTCTFNIIYLLASIICLFTMEGRCYWIEESIIHVHAVFNVDLTFLQLSSSFSGPNQILQFIFYVVWNKNRKFYWSEQCFTGFGSEDWCSSWGLINSRYNSNKTL